MCKKSSISARHASRRRCPVFAWQKPGAQLVHAVLRMKLGTRNHCVAAHLEAGILQFLGHLPCHDTKLLPVLLEAQVSRQLSPSHFLCVLHRRDHSSAVADEDRLRKRSSGTALDMLRCRDEQRCQCHRSSRTSLWHTSHAPAPATPVQAMHPTSRKFSSAVCGNFAKSMVRSAASSTSKAACKAITAASACRRWMICRAVPITVNPRPETLFKLIPARCYFCARNTQARA